MSWEEPWNEGEGEAVKAKRTGIRAISLFLGWEKQICGFTAPRNPSNLCGPCIKQVCRFVSDLQLKTGSETVNNANIPSILCQLIFTTGCKFPFLTLIQLSYSDTLTLSPWLRT